MRLPCCVSKGSSFFDLFFVSLPHYQFTRNYETADSSPQALCLLQQQGAQFAHDSDSPLPVFDVVYARYASARAVRLDSPGLLHRLLTLAVDRKARQRCHQHVAVADRRSADPLFPRRMHHARCRPVVEHSACSTYSGALFRISYSGQGRRIPYPIGSDISHASGGRLFTGLPPSFSVG